MTTRTDWSALRVHQIGHQMAKAAKLTLEALAVVAVFSGIGVLLAWRA